MYHCSFISALVVATTTLCESFRLIASQHPHRQSSFQQTGSSRRSLRRTSSVATIPTFVQSSTSLLDNRNIVMGRRRRVLAQRSTPRYMIGDMLASPRRGDGANRHYTLPLLINESCHRICCLPNALFTSWSFTTSTHQWYKPFNTKTTEIYCSAINPDDVDLDDAKNLKMKNLVVTTAKMSIWKEKLLQFSTIASILCVIDCTILPIVTVLLPLLGMVSSAVGTTSLIVPPAWNDVVHYYGHLLTLWFVLPIGCLATTTNYLYNHRKKWITSIGWLGLLFILAANTGHHTHTLAHQHHHVQQITAATASHANSIKSLIVSLLNNMQHGVFHRITNLTGCALLIASNYISHQYQKNHHVHGKNCCAPSPPSATTL